jgi:hypothetical protein
MLDVKVDDSLSLFIGLNLPRTSFWVSLAFPSQITNILLAKMCMPCPVGEDKRLQQTGNRRGGGETATEEEGILPCQAQQVPVTRVTQGKQGHRVSKVRTREDSVR